MAKCPGCTEQAGIGNDKCGLLQAAYILAGLAMMLNIRLSYSSAPYALIRFGLPENLFSVFVRRMASSLELWCLPSMLLGNIMDLFQKLFDGGAELRAIKAEAKELQGKATALQSTANSQFSDAGDVNSAAEKLKNKAELLNGAADAIASDKELKELQKSATALATAAGTTGDPEDSLHYHANELAGTQDHAKAIAVIVAFNKVKEAYEALSSHPTYTAKLQAAHRSSSPGSSTPEGKVKAVDDQYKLVKGDFEKLCKALIKHFATEMNTKAGALQSSPSVDTAGKFKEAYDEFGKVYNAIPDENAKTAVQTEWNNLKDVISGEMKRWKFYWIIAPSIVTQWLNFLIYVILLIIIFTVLISLEKILSQMPNGCSPRIYKIDYPCSTIKIQ